MPATPIAWLKFAFPRPKQPTRRRTFAFTFSLRKDKLRAARRHEGHYLLRSNLSAEDPAVLWERYIQLTEIEAVFRSLKSDLVLRPIFHQTDARIEAHILSLIHISEPTRLGMISYAVFCLKK